MLDLNRIVVEIAQAVERLPLRMDAYNLMARRLARSRNDANAEEQFALALHQFQHTSLPHHPQGTGHMRVGITQFLLYFGILPVGISKKAARVGETRSHFSTSFHCNT